MAKDKDGKNDKGNRVVKDDKGKATAVVVDGKKYALRRRTGDTF